MMDEQYSRRTRHSSSYYVALLQGLLYGINTGMGHKDIAASLNRTGVLSPVGVDWTTNGVTMALRSLREHRTVSSYLYTAMLSLVFDGILSRAQVLPLLDQKPNLRERM